MHPELGMSTGFDYTRTANPTRQVVEQAVAQLEQGAVGLAFASGMAAISCVFGLLVPGDHIIATSDLYGGTYRLFEQLLKSNGIDTTFVDTGDTAALEAAVSRKTRAIFIETPSNPTMRITDISATVAIARAHDVWTVVDNTFMTPYLQRPLELGADIVVHSATKYLGGHNDVTAGLVVAREEPLGQRLTFLQNSTGAVLSPFDSWLLLRGMKTLGLRMDRHQHNAQEMAAWLSVHPRVRRVYYPGLEHHPGRSVQVRQASGSGGMVSFEVDHVKTVERVLAQVSLIAFAESLGGVESLITYPARQTHADIPEATRLACGVTDTLLRLSVGIEDVADIVQDLEQALAY